MKFKKSINTSDLPSSKIQDSAGFESESYICKLGFGRFVTKKSLSDRIM